MIKLLKLAKVESFNNFMVSLQYGKKVNRKKGIS
jgi:hypothetical protein